jgi:hypothetical protein
VSKDEWLFRTLVGSNILEKNVLFTFTCNRDAIEDNIGHQIKRSIPAPPGAGIRKERR